MDGRENVKLNSEKQKEISSKKENDNWVFWTFIGMGLGVSLGAAFSNAGLGLAIGAGVGMCIGMSVKIKK